MKQAPSSKIRESKLWNIKEQFERGLNLAATSVLGHVTAALASAVPELDSTPINKLTDDRRSFVFDGAVRSVRSVLDTHVIRLYTPCPKKTCDHIFYNNFNNKCPITIIFGIVSNKSMSHRKLVSFPTSPI